MRKRKRIRISQCMIVKNEEKNIRQALSWGKGIVCEQIVVDTGSTDKTAEIAESMGAKVFHFTWCNDFSAAKNFAIEQASGDWIAFLDADEYFKEEEARKIPVLLRKIEDMSVKGTYMNVVRTSILHLDDDGSVFSIGQQDRIFRNREILRYRNRIHETLSRTDGKNVNLCNATDSLSIVHTGYQQSIMGRKVQRNTPMLERAVEDDPENYEMWSYLGESYSIEGRPTEALHAMEQAIEHGTGELGVSRLGKAFSIWFFTVAFLEDCDIGEYEEQARRYYGLFQKTGCNMPDVEFCMGIYLINIEKRKEAADFMERALERLDEYRGDAALKITGRMDVAYTLLAEQRQEEGDKAGAVRYGTLALKFNRYLEGVLLPLLDLLYKDPNTTGSQTYDFLSKIYDFTNLKDRLFVIKAAKKLAYVELEKILWDGMPEEGLKLFQGSK